jgi:hypothetical protein
MFRLIKLNPPHGWNAVAWELGIVTLGVLIALGAQQFADNIHWRGEVRDFREAVRIEISNNLATYTRREDQNRCIESRLDELQSWLDSWRASRPLSLTGPIGMPNSLAVRTGVWDSRDAGIVAHMSLAEKLGYTDFYTAFVNNEVLRLDERATWTELAGFEGATELDHQDQMRLQGLIRRAELRLGRMTGNADRLMKRAAARGFRPVPDPNWSVPERVAQICRPILPKPGAAL